MSSDQFTVEDNRRSSGGSGCTTIVIGCLVFCLVLAGIACGTGLYFTFTTNWTQVFKDVNAAAANAVESGINSVIDDTDLPEAQKDGMKAQITRLADGYREGKITLEQLKEVGDKMMKSPMMSAIPVEAARAKYIAPSGLSDAEKADAVKQMQRVAHGMLDKKITNEELETLVEGKIADKNSEGKLEFRDKVSDEQLREFITACKELADSKEIPDQNYEIDFAAEMKKAVDAVLDGKPDAPQAEVDVAN
ncbi:hypothetical protein [Blastopirellula marina]|uniref:Uncharacterized protein n=1 Tax=Blastopirellula marina TaxID=124 RepID=A0A2S8G0E8_9BACT|nr:hypothetical protein [Blastopirellula marina]PQO37903.1 hypothetical protein C5Y98_07345 [Blastopirellula marina]PTL44559.1 hypothetical protein C5Y97_07345 [Blastopirellula marina]